MVMKPIAIPSADFNRHCSISCGMSRTIQHASDVEPITPLICARSWLSLLLEEEDCVIIFVSIRLSIASGSVDVDDVAVAAAAVVVVG